MSGRNAMRVPTSLSDGIDWPDDPLDPAMDAAMDEWERRIKAQPKWSPLLTFTVPGLVFFSVETRAPHRLSQQLDSGSQLGKSRRVFRFELSFGVPGSLECQLAKLTRPRSDAHDASPSLVGDAESVGDEAPAPGVGENRPGAGNAEAAS